MSNQRPAKMYNPQTDSGNITLKQLIEFAKNAETELENNGESDAAFYFGQLHDWLKDKPHIGLNEKCSKILGL